MPGGCSPISAHCDSEKNVTLIFLKTFFNKRNFKKVSRISKTHPEIEDFLNLENQNFES